MRFERGFVYSLAERRSRGARGTRGPHHQPPHL